MTTVAIHQPEYMPWLGLLDKAKKSDVFVLLDDVQFNRASLQHRAKITDGKGGSQWLTIPFVHRHPQLICEVEIADEWQSRHAEKLAAVHDYRAVLRCAGMSGGSLHEFFHSSRFLKVVDAATVSMQFLFGAFNIAPKIVRSSELGAEGAKGDRVLDICRRLSATRYLSGRSGATYLDHEAFARAGVEIAVQNYTVPQYREGQPAVDGLSALDAWLTLGPEARSLLT